MTKIIETTVYEFNELNDKAKENARQWWRDGLGHDQWYDAIYEDAERVAKILGISVNARTYKTMGGGTGSEPAIYFSGFWSQGNGACFEGNYEYANGCARAIRDYAPDDTELHRIADQLMQIQKVNSYKLTATVKHTGRSSHALCTTIDVFAGDGYTFADGDTREKIAELLRHFMNWIYKQLEAEWDYINSDANVDECIRMNEYTFTETGKRFG